MDEIRRELSFAVRIFQSAACSPHGLPAALDALFRDVERCSVMSSSIPRISHEELPDELASFLKPRVERLGYLGEFYQCTAHQPKALLSFLELTEYLKHALPGNLTEVVSLTIARLMDNDYERVQHERL